MSLLNLQFPKEVGLFRKIVHTQTEFEKYWGALRNSQCAYMSVYSFRAVKPNGRRAEYNTAIVSNFVLDFLIRMSSMLCGLVAMVFTYG